VTYLLTVHRIYAMALSQPPTLYNVDGGMIYFRNTFQFTRRIGFVATVSSRQHECMIFTRLKVTMATRRV
jgi:hypothetical protein